MWKYVSRRIRDTFEKSINHFDKRSTTGLTNSPGANFTDDNKKNDTVSCHWFTTRKCWNSFHEDNNTKSKRWDFEHLNYTWISAITWSSAVVIGWYASQFIHLKHKYQQHVHKCSSINCLYSKLYPYINYVSANALKNNTSKSFENIVNSVLPTVHLVSNDKEAKKTSTSSEGSSVSDASSNDLRDVLNTIENKLGLAAIENGQHQDGINLLRSAASRDHAPAMYNLGLCYEQGVGVSINENTAMELYKSAAALKHPGALYNLGVYYGQGRGGLSRDLDTATRLLRLAAVQGQEDAIKAMKLLGVDEHASTSPDVESWSYQCEPVMQPNNFVPSPATTTLFVENINYSYMQNHVAIS